MGLNRGSEQPCGFAFVTYVGACGGGGCGHVWRACARVSACVWAHIRACPYTRYADRKSCVAALNELQVIAR